MKTATIFAALVALLLASPANAKTYPHCQHVYHVSSFQQGLGIGLIKMLRASREHHEAVVQGGPSAMPTYSYGGEPDRYTPVKVHEQWSYNPNPAPHHYRGGRLANLDAAC